MSRKYARWRQQNASAHQLDDNEASGRQMNEISCLVVESSVDEWIDEFIDQEIAFHTLIYKMTHNVVFERMTNIISRSVIINSTALNYRQGFDFTKYTELHTTLYEAIASRGSGNRPETRPGAYGDLQAVHMTPGSN